MVNCRDCKKDKPIEEFSQRKGWFTSTCKICHAYKVRISRRNREAGAARKYLGESPLLEQNGREFGIGMQGKKVEDLMQGVAFRLELARNASVTGVLYVKRWYYRDKPLTEAIIEFGGESHAFDLSAPGAGVRIPKALVELGVSIVAGPTPFRSGSDTPFPTQLDCLLIKGRRSVTVLKGAWECGRDTDEALGRQFRVDPFHLAFLARRGKWRKLKINPSEIAQFDPND